MRWPSDDDSMATRVTFEKHLHLLLHRISFFSTSPYRNPLRLDKMTTEYRIESDTFGDLQVPANVYWGAQTQRYAWLFELTYAFHSNTDSQYVDPLETSRLVVPVSACLLP